ncbi:sodium- and chloride-dependent glycine transporter 1-like [Portunus trituberculatus]|uniref:sodium- and chloride-dependent glycine transporter 1-like n=1 Tax=Portunus trituberculatus TaxID=210409 RepID=UPI001E1CD4DB|nr:sodium- and chloride-dependent glycine transporter 1-like [Portunus trituberculatus]
MPRKDVSLESNATEIRITVNRADDEKSISITGAEERGVWGNKIEFVLSCLSFAVGLGNIWRFPYLCYRNGGGAFLIPYAIMLLVTGLPLFFFELSLGQFGREGPITIWKVVPLFQGVGVGMFMIAFFIALYYNVIIAWAFFYLFSSFTAELPWQSCDHWWNTDACKRFDTKNCTTHKGIMSSNGTCFFRDEVNQTEWDRLNQTAQEMKLPADEFFHNFMLGISQGFHDDDGHTLQWHLSLCLVLSWVVVFFGLFKGVTSMGKAVYFTALFPYTVLIILFARAVTLPGYVDGITFYITPQWDKLLKARVWGDAAMQIFFSLGPCWGGLITLASYNKFNNNCLRDAIFICVANCCTSFFSGFVIFGIVGFMAHSMGVPVADVAAQGAGLAFVAYPEAVARLPLSPLWSILFFVMLLTLGLGSQFTIVQTVITCLVDFLGIRRHYKKTCTVVCMVGCAIGLIMCTRHGMYILQLLDNYSGTYSALMIGCIELIALCWVYGVDNFMEDIKMMLGKTPFPYYYWKIVWQFITPLSVFIILIFTFLDYSPTEYGPYKFPVWADVLGWLISFSCVLVVPIRACWLMAGKSGPLWARVQQLCRPDADWGPARRRTDDSVLNYIDSKTPLANDDEQHEMDRESPYLTRVSEEWEDEEDDGLQMKVPSNAKI